MEDRRGGRKMTNSERRPTLGERLRAAGKRLPPIVRPEWMPKVPFRMGAQAAQMGFVRNDCPHPAGSKERDWWLQGWDAAS